MRIAEAAFFVKGHGEGAFAGAHQQNRMGLPVGVFDIGDQRVAQAFLLKGGFDGDVLDFQHAISLVRHHADGSRGVFDKKGVESAALQIAVDHIFLLIAEQQ